MSEHIQSMPGELDPGMVSAQQNYDVRRKVPKLILVENPSAWQTGLGDKQVDSVENWQDKSRCTGVDPDLFFPERGQSVREAKAVCAECVVKDECLEFAINNGERFGIWGGTSERERRGLRKAIAANRKP